ncbi:diguanylate cyclase [Thiomicrorhabdus sp. Milos-T2]|uniref:diguanylate cyclase n=1 Tax=Thiomicrorhabdus sp. Milos-T2 TaxID=90814 RepID=UPI000AD7A34C|nr:diguanylate cyclase [Thiomicrorhabdus sp. Milos-T2]
MKPSNWLPEKFFSIFFMAWFLFAFSSIANSSDVQTTTALKNSKTLTPIKLQINWNHQFQFAGFYAAIQQGYYQQAGMDVNMISWKPGLVMTDEVISGRADFAVAKGNVITDYAKGKPLSLVMASFQYSPLVLLAHEPTSDLAQLSGKSVMYDGGIQIAGLLHTAKPKLNKVIKKIKSSGNIQDFIDHKVDYYTAYATNEPYRLKQLGVPFYVLDPKTYGVQTYGDYVVTSQKMAMLYPNRVKDFKDATIKGWQYAIAHQEEIVDFIIKNYPVVKSRDALLAEAKMTTGYVQSGSVSIGNVSPIKLQADAATFQELGFMTQAELDALKPKDFIFNDNQSPYSKQEIDYLKNHPIIKLGSDRDWAPFEFYDTQHGYTGLSADYFKIFEKKLGVKFKAVFSDSWASVVKMAKNGELAMYSCAVPSPERKEYMNFTQPYLSFPMALASVDAIQFVDQYSQLEGHTIAVVKGYWSHEILANDYPKVKLLVVDNIVDGLNALVDGRADGYLGNLASINYSAEKYGLDGVKIVGQFPERFELAMGVQKSDPILFSIIQKTLNSITPEERKTIFNRWVQLEVVNELNKKQLWQIFVPVVLVILSLLALVGIYAFQKSKQNSYIGEIHELSYATVIDVATLKIIWSSQSFAELSGYSPDELVGMPYLNLSWKGLEDKEIKYIYTKLISGFSWSGEMHAKTKKGTSYWVELTLTPKKNVFGQVKTVLATRVNITDKKRLEQLSVTDELTGLYNRRYFNEVIQSEIKRAQRDQRAMSVAMLDIDLFKKVNDTYGHQFGDEVLKQISKELKLHFHRASDFVFRMGGEEFLIISAFKEETQFNAYLEAFREQIQALNIKNEQAPLKVVTISVGGLYTQADKEMDFEAILKRVDDMLYRAKEKGRNRVEMYKNTPAKV